MFPNSNIAPRALENQPGVVYDEDQLANFFAEDANDVSGHLLAVEKLMEFPDGTVLNGKIAVSVSSNNITVALKTLAGSDATTDNPIVVFIGGVKRIITGALSVTKNAGTNYFGSGSAMLATHEVDYFVYLGFNSTDGVVIGFARFPTMRKYDDFSTTSTNDKYCAISTITNATSSDQYVNIGRICAILSATASFNWSLPTQTQDNLIQKPTYFTRNLSFTPGKNTSFVYFSSFTSASYVINGHNVILEMYFEGQSLGGTSNVIRVLIPFTNIGGAGHNCRPAYDGAVWQTPLAFIGASINYYEAYRTLSGALWAGTETNVYYTIKDTIIV